MWLSLSIADHHSVDQQHSQSNLENDHHDKTSLSPTLNADLIHKHWSLAFRGAQDLTAQLSVKDEPLSTKDQKIEPLQSVSQ